MFRKGHSQPASLNATLELAKKFGQGAIYAYSLEEKGLMRTTVPALSTEEVREYVRMARVPQLPNESESCELLKRPWAGPSELLHDSTWPKL